MVSLAADGVLMGEWPVMVLCGCGRGLRDDLRDDLRDELRDDLRDDLSGDDQRNGILYTSDADEE